MENENIFMLYALLMGVFITFVYDLLRIFRRVIPHNNFWVSVEDLGFWIFCGAEVFMLMYRESNGTLRWFAVLGALLGMLVYCKTISPLLVKYVSLGINKIKGLLLKILGFLLKPFAMAGRTAGKAAGRVTAGRKRFFRYLKKKLTAFLKMIKMILCKQ